MYIPMGGMLRWGTAEDATVRVLFVDVPGHEPVEVARMTLMEALTGEMARGRRQRRLKAGVDWDLVKVLHPELWT